MIRSLATRTAWPVLIVAGCLAPPSSNQGHRLLPSTQRTPTGSEAYHGLIQYRAKDSKAAITEPTLIPAREAMLAGGTKVIGIFVNGEARAYPLFMLNNHQIVNDLVGGTPVSASW